MLQNISANKTCVHYLKVRVQKTVLWPRISSTPFFAARCLTLRLRRKSLPQTPWQTTRVDYCVLQKMKVVLTFREVENHNEARHSSSKFEKNWSTDHPALPRLSRKSENGQKMSEITPQASASSSSSLSSHSRCQQTKALLLNSLKKIIGS